MTWLEELNEQRVYKYVCESSQDDSIHAKVSELILITDNPNFEADPGTSFAYEGKTYVYAGFDTTPLGIMTKVPFEKNGRRGVLTKFSNGRQVVRSATKENYYRGKGTDSILTKGCKEASEKVKENITHARMKGMDHELKKQIHLAKEAKRGRKT